MYYMMDSYSFYSWVYFVLLILIGSFFMINLCLVVIATQFSETKEREEKLMEEQRQQHLVSQSLVYIPQTTLYESIFIYLDDSVARVKKSIFLSFLSYVRRQQMPRPDPKYSKRNPASPPHPNDDNDQRSIHYHNHYYSQHLHFHINPNSNTANPPNVNENDDSEHEEPRSQKLNSPPKITIVDQEMSVPRRNDSPKNLQVVLADKKSRNTVSYVVNLPDGNLQSVNSLSDLYGLTNGAPSPNIDLMTNQSLAPTAYFSRKLQNSKVLKLKLPPTVQPLLPSHLSSSSSSQRSSDSSKLNALPTPTVSTVSNGSYKSTSLCKPAATTSIQSFRSVRSHSKRQRYKPSSTSDDANNASSNSTLENDIVYIKNLKAPSVNIQYNYEHVKKSNSKNDNNSNNKKDASSPLLRKSDGTPFSDIEPDETDQPVKQELTTWVVFLNNILSLSYKLHKIYTRLCLFLETIVDSKYFSRSVMIAILTNTVFMGIEHHNQDQFLTSCLEIANVVFTVIFTMEMISKCISKGVFKYLRSIFNLFDTIIVLIAIFEIIEALKNPAKAGDSGSLSVLRTFRLTRVLKLVRFMPALQRQLMVLMKTIDNVATFMLLLFLFIFIFAILGIHLFGCKFCFPITNEDVAAYDAMNKTTRQLLDDQNSCKAHYKRPTRANFNTLLWAFITVFQILTQEDWNLVAS